MCWEAGAKAMHGETGHQPSLHFKHRRIRQARAVLVAEKDELA
jgi:hypothetical protein